MPISISVVGQRQGLEGCLVQFADGLHRLDAGTVALLGGQRAVEARADELRQLTWAQFYTSLHEQQQQKAIGNAVRRWMNRPLR